LAGGELSFTERRDWLRLYRTATVGPVAFHNLITRYKSAGAALQALPELIRRRKGLSIPSLDAIEAEMAQSERWGVRIIASCEPDFPPYLAAVDPRPPLISLKGRIDILHRPCLAIVGSRNASAIGQKFARQIAAELGGEGYTIISGLARGIDAAAHTGALEFGTAGVLGGGVDHIYPRQNTELFRQMAEQGALISESPLGYKATARDFPRRNRIISGLCKGVIVIEAAERSGTLITARYAMEQNREVMAVPGSPLDPRSAGCNRLIQTGAALVSSAQDVIEVVEQLPPLRVMEPESGFAQPEFDWAAAQSEIEKARKVITGLLSPSSTPRDEIIRASELPLPIVQAALLDMELNGDVFVEADGRIAALR
jgi:DNA processing protein